MKSRPHLIWKLINTGFLVLGSSWVIYLFIQSISKEGASRFVPESWTWLIFSTGLIISSLLLNTVNFHQFLSSAVAQHISITTSLKLHIVGQVVRYLPGRFWGLLYQISSCRTILPAAAITRANIDLMLLALFGNLAVAAIILGVFQSIPFWLALLILVPMGIVLFFPYKDYPIKFFKLFVIRSPFVPQRVKKFVLALTGSRLKFNQAASIVTIFIISWIFYLLGWSCLGYVFPILCNTNLMVLCAWYTIAWMIGFAAALTPAGLGVREVIFIFMADQGVGSDTLSFVAIFARLWLMAADLIILLPLVPLLIQPQHPKKNENEETTSI